MLDAARTAAPCEPAAAGDGRDYRVGDRAAFSGVHGQRFGVRKIAGVEPEDEHSTAFRAVALGGCGVPGLRRDRYRAGFVAEQRQLVAFARRDRADGGHGRQQGGGRDDVAAGQERAFRGDGFFAVCRGRFSGRGHAGLDDRRDAAALGDVESGAPGHGREADGAAQAGRGFERDRRASCETSCADQVCTSGVGDAQVDRPRRRGRDRVAKLSAERGVLLRNLCECHWIVF